MARCFNRLKHQLIATLTEISHTIIFANAHPSVSVFLTEALCKINDVIATICITAERLIKGVHIGVSFRTRVILILNKGFAIVQKHLIGLLELHVLLYHDFIQLKIAL